MRLPRQTAEGLWICKCQATPCNSKPGAAFEEMSAKAYFMITTWCSEADGLAGQGLETILVTFFLSQDNNLYGSQHLHEIIHGT